MYTRYSDRTPPSRPERQSLLYTNKMYTRPPRNRIRRTSLQLHRCLCPQSPGCPSSVRLSAGAILVPSSRMGRQVCRTTFDLRGPLLHCAPLGLRPIKTQHEARRDTSQLQNIPSLTTTPSCPTRDLTLRTPNHYHTTWTHSSPSHPPSPPTPRRPSRTSSSTPSPSGAAATMAAALLPEPPMPLLPVRAANLSCVAAEFLTSAFST